MSASASSVALVDYLDRLEECYILIAREVLCTQEALLHSINVWSNKASQDSEINLSLADLYHVRSALSHDRPKIGTVIDLSQGTWKVTAELSDFFVLCRSKLVSAKGLLDRYKVPEAETFLSVDWSATALGLLDSWHPAKRNAIFHCLSLDWPAAVWLLPPGATDCSGAVMVHNKAYRTILGKKSSWAMGKSFTEIWAEVAEPVSKVCNLVIKEGRTVLTRDTTFCVDTLEDTLLREIIVDWAFMPIPGDDGAIIGMHNLCVDKTEDAFAYRRYEMLRKLGNTTSANNVSEVWQHTISAAEVLPLDLPVVMLYSVEQNPEDSQEIYLKLSGTTGLPEKHSLAVPEVWLNMNKREEHGLFPFKRIITTPDQVIEVRIDEEHAKYNTSRGWPDPLRNFAVVAVSLTGGLPCSVIVVALNPRTTCTAPYNDFLISVARKVDSALLAAGSKEADKTALARLESLVQQRTKEVQRHPLRLIEEQKDRADVATRARKEQEAFVDVVQHEIRNPTSCIVQGGQLLNTCLTNLQSMNQGLHVFLETLDELESLEMQSVLNDCATEIEECMEVADSISLAARHQSVIASDILSTSKLHDGLLAIKPIDMALAYEIENIMSVFEIQARASNINLSIVWETASDNICVKADPTRLNQIIVNLLSNSLRFLEASRHPRSCFLRVSLEKEKPTFGPRTPMPPDNRLIWLIIHVQDNGPGISPEDINSLFTRFNTSGRKNFGSGLGLYLCRKLCQLQHGEINVTSTVGEGTTFSFYIGVLPGDAENVQAELHKRQQALERRQRSPKTLSPLPSNLTSRRRSSANSASTSSSTGSTAPLVLVVEDNAISSKLLKRQLEKKGFRTATAANGFEALAIIAANPGLSSVFLDVEMPQKDGMETIKELREMEATSGYSRSRLPVCGVTGNARDQQIEAAIAAGMDKCLTKPYQFQQILDFQRQYGRKQLRGAIPE